MTRFSSREAARKLGIGYETLSHYIEVGKVPKPETVKAGKRMIHLWTEEEIEHVRQLLPKIANGRKTRWQRQKQAAKKKHSAVSTQQSAKPKKKKRK